MGWGSLNCNSHGACFATTFNWHINKSMEARKKKCSKIEWNVKKIEMKMGRRIKKLFFYVSHTYTPIPERKKNWIILNWKWKTKNEVKKGKATFIEKAKCLHLCATLWCFILFYFLLFIKYFDSNLSYFFSHLFSQQFFEFYLNWIK